MKRAALASIAFALCLLLAPTAAAPAAPSPSDLGVDLWPDRGDDAVYDIGEGYELFFRPTHDCFVTIYEIGTEGDVRILFPRYPDDGWVFGGMIYRLPDYYGRGVLRAEGPRGVAYIHAVATRHPDSFNFGFRSGAYMLDVDPVSGDPFLAMNDINRRIIPPTSIHATATVTMFIGGHVWYPRYTCRGCHAHSRFRYDPYTDVCPKYCIMTSDPYDYWWDHSYHPSHVRFVFTGPFWRFELRTGRHYRDRHGYVHFAHGYGNYHPRVIPQHRYVYQPRREPANHVYREYQRGYTPVTYDDTRQRSRERTTGAGTRERNGIATPSSPSVRDRSDEAARQRTDAPPTDTRSRERVEQPRSVTPAPDTRSRERVEQPRSVTPAPDTRSRDRSEQPRSVTPTPDTRSRDRVEQPRSTAPSSGSRSRGGDSDSRRR